MRRRSSPMVSIHLHSILPRFGRGYRVRRVSLSYEQDVYSFGVPSDVWRVVLNKYGESHLLGSMRVPSEFPARHRSRTATREEGISANNPLIPSSCAKGKIDSSPMSRCRAADFCVILGTAAGMRISPGQERGSQLCLFRRRS